MAKTTANTSARLAELRKIMAAEKLQAYIIPRQDEFQGEYVAAYAERLRWATGFAGSWGQAIVGTRKAAIFVDGRYTVQVRQQVDAKLIVPHHLIDHPPAKWLEDNIKKGETIGFDPWLTPVHDATKLAETAAHVGAKAVAVASNLVDRIWTDKPTRPSEPVVAHAPEHAGKSSKEKLKDAVKLLHQKKADAAFLADPASVCWAFNIRGSDVPYTPFVLAYAIINAKGKADLFIDPQRMAPALRKALATVANIHVPGKLEAVLKAFGKSKSTMGLDPMLAPHAVRMIVEKAGGKTIAMQDPCTLPKARKNETERQGARDAQRRDGAALSRFLKWVEDNAPTGMENESSAALTLKECRAQSNLLRDLSFETISASGPNAASPHYHLHPESARPLKNGEIYLIDSGGQYLDGTTDVTRTVIVGEPTEEMRDRFTRVLKGMIDLSVVRFPKGTTGAHIDALARNALWRAGLDYDHGTGHGVGSYLSVHEGPARISKASHVVLDAGMILSNEPGYYKPGHFGIRIENLLLVHEPQPIANGEREMMGFETLTLAPIDRKLIDTQLLTREELHWLDTYHARVLAELSPLLDADTAAWLAKACAPFS